GRRSLLLFEAREGAVGQRNLGVLDPLGCAAAFLGCLFFTRLLRGRLAQRLHRHDSTPHPRLPRPPAEPRLPKPVSRKSDSEGMPPGQASVISRRKRVRCSTTVV